MLCRVSEERLDRRQPGGTVAGDSEQLLLTEILASGVVGDDEIEELDGFRIDELVVTAEYLDDLHLVRRRRRASVASSVTRRPPRYTQSPRTRRTSPQ
jgi:hypothetical protein